MKKKTIQLFISMMAVMILAGGPVTAATKTIKVGVTAPFVGGMAIWGRDAKASVEMAFEAIDYTIGDYKFEIVWIDSQSDPAKATNAFAEAIEAKDIDVAFYDVHSSISVALMDLVAKYKIPLFFPLGAADTINQKWLSDPEKFSYFGGKGWPDPGKLTAGYVECLENAIKTGIWKPKNKKVGLYGEDTDWGRSFCAQLGKVFKEAGWTVVAEEYSAQTQTDFYPLIAKFVSEDVSVVAGSMGSVAISNFVKQTGEMNFKGFVIADGLGWAANWHEMTGKASNYVLDMIPKLTTPEAIAWSKQIEDKYGFKPGPSSGGQVYDYANFFIKVSRRVLERFGKLDRDSYYKVLIEEVNTGKLTYSKADGAVIMNEYKYTKESMPDPLVGTDYYYFPVLQYFNGESRIIYPEAWKQADIEFKK